MNMFETLFGGALAIAVVYHVLRMSGVSNYWRGVISGGIPLLGYLGYSIVRWPGGDVLSMHVAIYLATATVLTLIGGRKPTAGKGIPLAAKAFIAFFLVIFAVNAGLLFVSGRGIPPSLARLVFPKAENTVHTAFSGVVPHGEEAAKSINQYLAHAHKQNTLGWQVALHGLDTPIPGHELNVNLTAASADGGPLRDAQAGIAFIRPGQSAPDIKVALYETDPGIYKGQAKLDQAGLWLVVARVQRGEDRFEIQQTLEVKSTP